MKKKIYVASSWRNAHQPKVVKLLRAIGHEVYDFRNPSPQTGFDWAEIDVKWQHWTPEEYVTALKHPRAEQAFNSDFDAMKWADTCVMVLPCGRSANTEAGWMKGAGKSVYVYQPVMQEPELMYKIYDGIFVHEYELVDHFVHLEKQQEVVVSKINITSTSTVSDPDKRKVEAHFTNQSNVFSLVRAMQNISSSLFECLHACAKDATDADTISIGEMNERMKESGNTQPFVIGKVSV